PLALTIFGCSMLSGLRERFSAGAGAGAAPSSFFAFGAVFFFGSAGAAPAPAADASALGASLWTSAASGFGSASFAAALGAFGFLVASSHGFTRTFAGAGVRAGALATNRQAPPVPNPAITIDRLQTFEVALHFTTQIAFNRDLVARDRMNNFV